MPLNHVISRAHPDNLLAFLVAVTHMHSSVVRFLLPHAENCECLHMRDNACVGAILLIYTLPLTHTIKFLIDESIYKHAFASSLMHGTLMMVF